MDTPTKARPAQIGGSFAPKIDANILNDYRLLARDADPQTGEAMLKLCTMVETFNQTPASTLPGKPHPSSRGLIVPLEDAEIKRIWDHVPWDYECDAIQRLFDEIPARQKDLRNAAFHLLWYAKELGLDREPMTKDRL